MKRFISLLIAVVFSITLISCDNSISITIENDTTKNTFAPLLTDPSDTYVSPTTELSFEEKQKEILKYINEDIVSLLEPETNMITSYTGVSGTNYTSDFAMYEEISEVTLKYAKEVKELARGMYFETYDLQKTHDIYLEYIDTYIAAFEMILEAIDEQDKGMIDEANKILDKGTSLAEEYQSALYDLAEKYEIEIN